MSECFSLADRAHERYAYSIMAYIHSLNKLDPAQRFIKNVQRCIPVLGGLSEVRWIRFQADLS